MTGETWEGNRRLSPGITCVVRAGRSHQTARLNTSRANNKKAISLYDRVSILIRYCYETSLSHWLTRNERLSRMSSKVRNNQWMERFYIEHFILNIYIFAILKKKDKSLNWNKLHPIIIKTDIMPIINVRFMIPLRRDNKIDNLDNRYARIA